MNEYLEIFHGIIQSVEGVSTNQYHSLDSLEIKQSALGLQESIQPCVQELSASAGRLKDLLKPCFEQLDCTEDIWASKQRIAQVSDLEVWQQLGEISGCQVRIKELLKTYQANAIEKNQQTWESRIDALTQKYFLDSNQKMKKGIGYSDKEGFLKEVVPEISKQSEEINQTIKDGFDLIFQVFKRFKPDLLQPYICLLDIETQIEQKYLFKKLVNQLYSQEDDLSHLPNMYLVTFYDALQSELKVWKDRWGDILHDEVIKFKAEGKERIETRITLLLNDRTQQVEKILDQMIRFYDDLLEKRDRYQQETVEQRLAEKSWIDQQRKDLERIKTAVETVVNPFQPVPT